MCWLVAGAIALSIVGPWVAGWIWHLIRSDIFKKSRAQRPPSPVASFTQPILNLTFDPNVEALRKNGSDFRDPLQESAKRAQNTYHRALAHGVSAIAIAFITLSAAVVWGADNDKLVLFSAIVDVVCFVFSIFAFWRAAFWNKIWMTRRAKNELIRQWCVLDNLFEPKATTKAGIEANFNAFSGRVEAALGSEPKSFLSVVLGLLMIWRKNTHTHNDIVPLIQDFWDKTRRADVEAMLTRVTPTYAQFSRYFEKRPKAQAEWFPRSQKRLAGQGHWRANALLLLFLAALAGASVKLALLLGYLHELKYLKPTLTFLILVLIGLSAAISAFYLNQNSRSLAHRYSAQQRHIERWLALFRAIVDDASKVYVSAAQAAAANVATVLSRQNPPPTPAEVAKAQQDAEIDAGRTQSLPAPVWQAAIPQLLEFEDLMIEEMLDFIAISEHDMLEISAA